jgi:ribosomal-protein-alanine N-acetyltransferase
MMKAPERIQTARLLLRKPVAADAGAIFSRYAADAEVTRLLSWPRHRSIDDTRGFLSFSDQEWERWPAGPYLIEARETAGLLGSTGLAFDNDNEAGTGYVLVRDAWGLGYATEALTAMVILADKLGVRHLYALCHTSHAASAHVLEKCGFECGTGIQRGIFPNLGTPDPQDMFCYTIRLNR